jgi:hypothetical protein
VYERLAGSFVTTPTMTQRVPCSSRAWQWRGSWAITYALRPPCQREPLARCFTYSLAPLGVSTMISVVAGRDDLLTMSVSLSRYRVETPFPKASTRARLSR